MNNTSIAGLCAALLLVPFGEILAADGAIPIWEPTTITEPGSYVLTRNIAWDGAGDGIRIEASDVDLDLGGFRVEAISTAILAVGNGVSIHDGVVSNSDEAAVEVSGDNFVIRGLTLVTGDDEVIRAYGNNGIIKDVVVGPASYGGPGIQVYGSGITIRDNVISNVGYGIWILEPSEYWDGRGNQIIDNTISDCYQGIYLEGSFNVIAGNLITGNSSFGLRFSSGSTGNVYRRNTARGNAGTGCTGTASGADFCDEGTNNTSHGDNYMPGKM